MLPARIAAEYLIQDLDEMPETKDAAPKAEPATNAFAANLREQMERKGMSVTDVAEAVNKRGNVSITEERIRQLRSSGAKSGSLRKPKIFTEIAAVLDCTIDDLFGMTSGSPPSDDEQEIFRMVSEALQGPKGSFLRDAIDMAHSAARLSKKLY